MTRPPILLCAGIKQKAFQQTEMLANKGKNIAKGVKVDVPVELAKNTGGLVGGVTSSCRNLDWGSLNDSSKST